LGAARVSRSSVFDEHSHPTAADGSLRFSHRYGCLDAGAGGCNRRHVRPVGLDLSDYIRPARSTVEVAAVTDTSPKPKVDRRKFLNGEWTTSRSDRTIAAATSEIASILVQTRPERLDDAAQAIGALPGTQIYNRDPRGKLVVVIEAADVGSIGAALNTISLMPNVLTAALVFHGTDDS